MDILNVAEKNSAASSISHFLSGGHTMKKEGASKFNKIFEFKYKINGNDRNMIMTSVSGHLLSVEFASEYRNWQSVNPLELFECPVNKNCLKDNMNVKKNLEQQARRCSMLIIWTDCDREGENIGSEIIEVCQNVRANMIVKRAVFSEITKNSVTRAMNNLTDIDFKKSKAVDVRQELDLRIGAAFTRLQTLYLQPIYPQSLNGQVVSYGPCQFPTLGFVVERFKAIESFISEPFWKLTLIDERKNQSIQFNWDRVRLFDRNIAMALFENITEGGGSIARVISISRQPKSKWRPTALDTVQLEKLASRVLKISAKECMTIAEKLYSQGYISYPRTETNIYPKDINMQQLVEVQIADTRWSEFASKVIRDGCNPRNGTKTDEAHPPIHPLKNGYGLTNLDARVFELITRHFLACLSKDAKGSETKISLDCVSNQIGQSIWNDSNANKLSGYGEGFNVSGLIVQERNYLDVYPYDKWSDRELPDYQFGETFVPKSVSIDDSSTTPPPLLTESALISLMEKHGIGTDATHAEHIDKVKIRNYIGNDGQYLLPGQLGMGLVEGYDLVGISLSKPDRRANLEADLLDICRGTKQPNEVLRNRINEYKSIFIDVASRKHRLNEGLAKYLQEAPKPASATAESHQSNNNRVIARENSVSVPHHPPSPPHPTAPSSTSNSQTTEFPSCLCGNKSVKRKVLKEGINKGKFFFTCASSSCKFFQWADQTATTPAIQTQSSGSSTQRMSDNPGINSLSCDTEVMCNCAKQASQFTVNKENQNKGRKFYTCRDCDFFQWADESSSSGNISRPPQPIPPQVKGKSKSSVAPKKRKFTSTENMWPPVSNEFGAEQPRKSKPRSCGRCRMPGHNAKNCPAE